MPSSALALFFLLALQPAAVSAPTAAERSLTFPGFNGFSLNGSVLPGLGHPYFAVLVAGSGPTDRDWSNPLIPVPSHGGRDFARWLQGQGIGSLRYDKRFIGSRNPALDISLDAQVGDIRAALQAARKSPEAKGRKLLLIGHSEGALLSLLAAQEADALLLLGLPGQSLRRQIQDQVRMQFEKAGFAAEVSKKNQDYLAAGLESLSTGKEIPAPGEGVLPALATLMKSLARPESLAFFRATMDLDPWRLASRVAVPHAAAWGDRDVQSWKPLVPSTFRGAVLELPGANHLLKRETRPAAELSGANAASAYGDDTPMADLAPLATWLATLPGTPQPPAPSLMRPKEAP
jgi:hypothetical protein